MYVTDVLYYLSIFPINKTIIVKINEEQYFSLHHLKGVPIKFFF